VCRKTEHQHDQQKVEALGRGTCFIARIYFHCHHLIIRIELVLMILNDGTIPA